MMREAQAQTTLLWCTNFTPILIQIQNLLEGSLRPSIVGGYFLHKHLSSPKTLTLKKHLTKQTQAALY